MRSLFIISVSAALLSGCLTTQENPNYEYSTAYKGNSPVSSQYATSTPAEPAYAPTYATYESVPAQAIPAQPVYSQPVYSEPATVQASSADTTVLGASPTDSFYSSSEVTGTPGFMALQNSGQSVTLEAATQPMPEAEYVSVAPLGAAGTPIDYDYGRNIVSIDSTTTGSQVADTVRVLGSAVPNYIVQQGDTVYSLSRKTCVGVNVIQSLNELDTDYAINIGQSLTLPTSVC